MMGNFKDALEDLNSISVFPDSENVDYTSKGNEKNGEIIQLIKDRLDLGQQRYGSQLDPQDGRDWQQESLEEILDGMVYIAAEILRLKQDACENKCC
tara:strand:+ start:2738 stop:3028 length:291 start_codon:yes stop_codon:yes gene_type:complete